MHRFTSLHLHGAPRGAPAEEELLILPAAEFYTPVSPSWISWNLLSDLRNPCNESAEWWLCSGVDPADIRFMGLPESPLSTGGVL